MYNRILLILLIVGVWLLVKLVDNVAPAPTLLIALLVILTMMFIHSAWLLAAQRRWRRKLRKLRGIGDQLGVLLPAHNGTQAQEDDVNDLLNDWEASIWRPWVDIFISAKNEAKVIESTIRNMFAIDYPNYSLWIIDDNSTDDMPQVLSRLKQEFPRLNVLQRQKGSYPGKSAALNEALPLSKGEVIAVFDADANVDPNFFKLLIPVLEPEEVGAVQAQKKLYPHHRSALIECQSSEYAVDVYFQMGRDLIGGIVELRGNGQLIKRNALIDVGGWNNKSITDDLDLTMRLVIAKWDIRFCPQAVVWEEGVPTIKSLIRQRRRWAEGSIRRYLDYIFPLNTPSGMNIIERFDVLTFVTEFTIPALVFLEVVSEAVNLATGGPVHPRLLLAVLIGCAVVSQFNFFSAFRLYRPELSVKQALIETFQLTSYVFPLWLPCIFYSLWQIMFRRGTSTWHPTEHIGQSQV